MQLPSFEEMEGFYHEYNDRGGYDSSHDSSFANSTIMSLSMGEGRGSFLAGDATPKTSESQNLKPDRNLPTILQGHRGSGSELDGEGEVGGLSDAVEEAPEGPGVKATPKGEAVEAVEEHVNNVKEEPEKDEPRKGGDSKEEKEGKEGEASEGM